jgi:Double zinc ribbon
MNTFNEPLPGNSGTGTSLEPARRGFWGNLGLIRPVAWVIAAFLFVGMQLLFWLVIWPQVHADEMARMPLGLQIFLPLLASSVAVFYVLIVGFVYVDAKRRGMRHVMWTWLVAVIPDFIGVILYFVMRDPMPTPCPKCSRLSAQSFTFCPSCGAELMRTCRVCHKKLGQGWANCAYCGTTTAQAGSSAPTA